MAEKPLPIAKTLGMLAEAPGRIAAAADGLDPALPHAAPAPGDWSMNQVLAHLRACSDVWGGCIARILAEDHPTLTAVNPRTYMAGTDFTRQPFAGSLFDYTQQRAALVTDLTALPPELWQRSARLVGAGRPVERTVADFTRRLAIHERAHLKQIERAASLLRGLGG